MKQMIVAIALSLLCCQPSTGASTDGALALFVPVQDGVKLEVLDYGGNGRSILFLSALGPDAHEWDQFAPKFKAGYHVYAITRRGFGASDKPAPSDANYDANRLGDDVVAVMEYLHLSQPVLVGHSVGGEELSSVGSRFPSKVAGLIYLDAGYSYAFYDREHGDTLSDQTELKRLIVEALQAPPDLALEEKLLASIELNEKELRASIAEKRMKEPAGLAGHPASQQPSRMPQPPAAMKAIVTNTRKFTTIPVPILAIFAVPHDLSRQYKEPDVRASKEAQDAISTGKQVNAFQAALPSARVVRLAHADHDIFVSNEADVIGEMNTFLKALPAP